MEIKISNKGRQVVIAATLINFMTGMMYTWSIISKALIGQYGWSAQEASLPYSVFTIFFTVAMVIFGKFQDLKGPKISGILGSMMIGFGFILSGLFLNPQILLISIGVVTGMGAGIISISTTPPAIKWFHPSMKGKITGIVVGGVGLSAVFYSPLVNILISRYGISQTFIYLGLIVLSTALGLSTRLVNPSEGYNFQNFETKKPYVASIDTNWREMLKAKEFYKLWIMLGLTSSAGLMVITHISNIARIQIGWQVGFILVIIIAIFNTLGRVIGGVLSDNIGRLEMMRWLFIIQGLNMILFKNAISIPIMVICVSITGLCYGATFAVFPATLGDYYGTKNFGLNYGILFTGWGIGGIIGPMTGATIFDAFGNYNTAFIIGFFLMVIATIITFTFKNNSQIY